MAAGQALTPGHLVSFTFVLVNGNSTQSSPSVDIAGSGCASTGYVTELAFPVDDYASTLHLAEDPTFALTVGSYLGIESEIFEVVSLVGGTNNSIEVSRGQKGSSISAHPINAQVRMMALTNMGRSMLSNETEIKLAVADGLGLHAAFEPGAFIKVDNEIMLIQSLADLYLTVTRGMQGTTAATHVEAALAECQ